MQQNDALISEEQVQLLQQFIQEVVIEYMSPQVNSKRSTFRSSSDTVDVSIAAIDKIKSPFLRIPFSRKSYPEWFSYKLEVNVERAVLGDTRPLLASVAYRNLSSFLPKRSTVRLNDDIEKEYYLLSDIVANWFIDSKTKTEIRPLFGNTLSMEFRHKAPNFSLRHWEARCAVAKFAMFDNSWDILACNTETLNETSTRCFCTKTGAFAVILTDKVQKSFGEKLEIHKFVVMLGCSICFILSTASGVVLLVHWSKNRTCLLFVKLQCCFSVAGAMMVFIVALATAENNQTASYAMCMMVFLETFLLIAASTQLSKLLVVYAEFVHFPKRSGAKLTVIGIITGVPLLTVFGNHTAHRAMNVKLKTWWIVTGSLSFYVFMTCFVIIILLYVFVYFVVESKIHQFLKFHHKSLGCFQQRIYLLHRSALIFIFLITTTLSSIAYVNYSSEVYWHYEFCAINISLGVVIVISYVVKKDNLSYMDIIQKLKNEKKDMIIANSKNKHLTFYTKEDAEAESESTPESHYATRTTKVRFASEPQIDLIDHAPEVIGVDVLENYKNSPKSFRRSSLDVLQPESECLELDLVISFRPDEVKKVNLVRPRVAVCPPEQENAPKLEFKTFHKNSPPEVKSVEGKIEDQDKEDTKGAGTSKDLDVVLTSISQDLEYLLNQEEDLRDTLKKKRTKSPGKAALEVIENRKYPESLTGISRTHC
ncbi:hypothetical protein WA026_023126 [Henosepilachna vigintioctopunctata]|uniref:Uncharacterized protein n=1 Tax=Henosepilachna vigintioctopunctata TaxID=420089 RepID=A0AAW1UDH8_9CUCU